MIKNDLFKGLLFTAVAAVVVGSILAANYFVMAWVAPTAHPPGGSPTMAGHWSESGGDVYYNTGDVGIGTNNPEAILHILNGDANGGLMLEHSNQASNYSYLFNVRQTEGLVLQRWLNGAYNANLMTVDYNGNVGIGTTDPGQKTVINVNGAGSLTSLTLNNQHPFGGAGVAASQLAFTRDPGGQGDTVDISASIIGGTSSDTTSNSGYLSFLTRSPANVLTERMMIDKDGNVGIGDTSPDDKLDVEGHVTFGSDADRIRFEQQGTFHRIAFEELRFYDWNAGGDNMVINNGKIKIGNTGDNDLPAGFNWDYTLQLDASDTSSIGFHDSGSSVSSIRYGANLFTIGGDDGWGAKNVYFPGNVGIGTNAPQARLDVRGAITTSNQIELAAQASGNRYSYIDFHSDDTYTDYGLRILRYNTGANAESRISHRGTGILRIHTLEAGSHIILHPAGNVGIGVTNPGEKLEVNGKIKSALTAAGDADDIVATKSYVDDIAQYSNCGWRNGLVCNAGELMNGYNNLPQVYCCGASPITCTPTGWTTYNSVCSANCSSGCGVANGTWTHYQSRILADCLIDYQNITGGSCSIDCGACTTPYLFTYADSRYLLENDVMSTFFQKGNMTIKDTELAYKNDDIGRSYSSQDIYKLKLKPEINNNKFKLQIRELEPEESNIDRIQLIKVTRDKDSYSFSDNQEIYAAKMSETKPFACIDETGADCLDQLLENDDNAVRKEPGGFIELDFKVNEQSDNFLAISSWESLFVPKLITSPLDEAYPNSLMITSYYKDGEWQRVAQDFHPRAVKSDEFVKINVSEYADENGNLRLKIEWTDVHSLDKVALVSVENTPFTKETLELISAVHSNGESVLDKLTGKDYEYAHIVRDDIIDFVYDAGKNIVPEGKEVDYFFISEGFYHGLRTYLYPEVDTSSSYIEEINEYIEELNEYLTNK